MARKLVMTLAMSLDGYIADADGGYQWIQGDGNRSLDTIGKWDFHAFLENVDTVLMGRACYDQNMQADFRDKTVYVPTSRPLVDHDNVRFIGGDVCAFIREELSKDGKDIYLFGGGKALDPFLKADMVDEYIIGIIPIILGSGRPLFYPGGSPISLSLVEYMVDEGTVILRYVRRAAGRLSNEDIPV